MSASPADSNPKKLGIVTGYRGEARCLSTRLNVLCSGADSGRARAAARQLHGEGVGGLVSFGLAGGLVPDVDPGDLLLPVAVVTPDGDRIPTDPAWRDELAAILGRSDIRGRDGPIAGSEHMVTTNASKRALAASTCAVAVDMESHALAEVAAEAGLPLLVVRAIADSCDQLLPSAVRGTIDARGAVRHHVLLAKLLIRPWQVVPLIALGRSSARGLATLRRVAALAPDLGFA
ncbi:MAG: hypothetical protein AAF637_01325 [Pseudomonadota bacterium]